MVKHPYFSTGNVLRMRVSRQFNIGTKQQFHAVSYPAGTLLLVCDITRATYDGFAGNKDWYKIRLLACDGSIVWMGLHRNSETYTLSERQFDIVVKA